MKLLHALTALALASNASAHYIFIQFSAGTKKFEPYQNIRKNLNNNSPVTDLASKDLRCNVGGALGGETTVAPMKAGDSFTFTSDQQVYHNGAVSLFLSKAPLSVHDYDGSGKWAKLKDWGPTFTGAQATWPLRTTYTHTLPKCLPPGEYLLRIQSLAVHNPGGVPQFYMSCAQINVTGGTDYEKWQPTLDIPGAFKKTDPGYTVNIYDPNFKSYTVPGGPEFAC